MLHQSQRIELHNATKLGCLEPWGYERAHKRMQERKNHTSGEINILPECITNSQMVGLVEKQT